jgi:hypothetical protein
MDDSGLDHRFDSGKGYKTQQAELDDVERYVAGCMLLRHVARGEREQARKICAEDGRLVNYRDYDRRTALHLAASEGRLGVVVDLLNAGARPNRADRWGGSPLDDALRHRHHAVAAELRKRGARLGAGLCGKSTSASGAFTPSNRRRVDGVEDHATIRTRRNILISTQAPASIMVPKLSRRPPRATSEPWKTF